MIIADDCTGFHLFSPKLQRMVNLTTKMLKPSHLRWKMRTGWESASKRYHSKILRCDTTTFVFINSGSGCSKGAFTCPHSNSATSIQQEYKRRLAIGQKWPLVRAIIFIQRWNIFLHNFWSIGESALKILAALSLRQVQI